MSIDVVKQFYAAFADGDMPKILSFVAEDCRWDHTGPPGPPFNKVYEGVAGVEEFFKDIAETLDTFEFEVNEWFQSGDRVVALGVAGHRVIATGKEYRSDFAMSHTVRDGKVTHWKPVFDMTLEAQAFEP